MNFGKDALKKFVKKITPLQLAASLGLTQITEYLLELGADALVSGGYTKSEKAFYTVIDMG